MKTSMKHAKNKRPIIIFIVVFLLIITGITCSYFLINKNDTTNQNKQKAAQENSNDKKTYIESDQKNNNIYSGANSNDIKLSAKQESNGTTTISSELYNISDGICTLDIISDTNKYSSTASVIYQPNFSTCAGFSVSNDKLGLGKWTITLTVSSKGKTASNSTIIEVK